MKRKSHGFGKRMNHKTSKNKNYNKNFDRDYDKDYEESYDENYSDDIEYDEEYYEDEYYADAEYEGEYYAEEAEIDEEGYYSEEAEADEAGYYAEEVGADEAGYYAEEAEADEEGYYAEEVGADEAGYYADETEADEEGCYAEEAEADEEGYYADEQIDYAYLAEDEGIDAEVSQETMEFVPLGDEMPGADETYREDEIYEDEIYDDEIYEAETYREDEIYDEEIYDEEIYGEAEDDGAYYDNKKIRRHSGRHENAFLAFFHNLGRRLSSMTAMDRIVAATGAVVLAIVLVTCSVYASARAVDAQVAALSEVGDRLDSIGVAGESGLVAMADAGFTSEEVDALFEEETETETESEEKKEESIGFNMTSVEKDLKIKFVNSATNRLISGIPFEVEVTGPDKKTNTWVDDDKDGVIYKKGLTAGSYEVALKEIDALKDYKYYTGTQSVKVKDKIEYVKIDVIDEVKTEAEVNAAVEDTAKHQQEQAPAVKDTVEWVESSKTPIEGNGEGAGEYVELDKKKITDPLTVSAASGNFMKLSKTVSEAALTETESESKTESEPPKESQEPTEAPPESSESPTEKPTEKPTETPPESSETPSEKPTEPEQPKDPYKIDSVTLNHSSVTMTAGGTTFNLQAKVNISGSTGEKPKEGVKWTSSNEQVVKVSGGTLTSVGVGTATITAASEADSSKKAECTVTVNDTELKLTLSTETLALKVNESSKLTVTISKGHEIAKTEWKTSNDKIAAIAQDGTVKGIAAGEANVTAKVTTKGNKTVEAVCKVTVSNTDVKLKLDKEKLTIFTELTGELKATIENTVNGDEILWIVESDKKDKEFAKVVASDDKKKATVTGVNVGEAKVSIIVKRAGKEIARATSKVTVRLNPKKDTITKLKDNDGNQVYIKDKDGKFIEATLADYYKKDVKFYILNKNVQYKYTGWQTIDGKTYYFTKDGKKVTGEQIIQGMKYNFDSEGALMKGSGNMGIDVSKWNGDIDWNAVKNSGVSYVIIRCGYRGSSTGAMIVDPKFKKNIQGASAAGLKVGIYFFSQAVNEVEAVEEASMTLSLIKGYKISYPVFIDIEGSGGRGDRIDRNTRTAVANAFCKTIQNGGYSAGIYANKTWFEGMMNTGSLTGYKLWLAQYAAQPTYKATRYDMWQYTSKGKINGIKGNVDLNISYLGY